MVSGLQRAVTTAIKVIMASVRTNEKEEVKSMMRGQNSRYSASPFTSTTVITAPAMIRELTMKKNTDYSIMNHTLTRVGRIILTCKTLL